MKFKALLSLIVAIATILFIISCDDNISTIGQGIQPDTDNIQMEVDSVYLTAETVQLDPNVYLRTSGALLGVLDDPVMGRTKSEFLAEFYGKNEKFILGYDGSKPNIDSVFLSIKYPNYALVGDSLSPMAVSVYELTDTLTNDFYTNIKPSDYSNKQVILGQRYFRHTDLKKAYDNNTSTKKEIGKNLEIELEKSYGQKLYKGWEEGQKSGHDIFENSVSLRKILKGIYVTSDLGNKTLIEVYDSNSSIQVLFHYSYKIERDNGTKGDTTAVLRLEIAGTTIQLNSIVDTPLQDVIGDKTKAYVKSPAGVATKITIPIAKIIEQAEAKTKTKDYIINSSIFQLTGMTEKEEELSIKNRPSRMLFINKDSLDGFFLKPIQINDASSAMLFRHTKQDQYGNYAGSNNTYHFNVLNTTNQSNNLSSLINHYVEKEKEKEKNGEVKKEFLEFYLIPVNIKTSTSSGVTVIERISNTISPSAAIFRTDEKKNMKMSLMYSKYNQIK